MIHNILYENNIETFAIPCVGAIIESIIDNQPHILIQERYKDNESLEKGLLEIPAGKIREYENIYNALRREIKEETGLDVIEIQGEKDCYFSKCNNYITMNFRPYECTQNFQGGYSIILHTFICRAQGNMLEKTNESRFIRWESCNELKQLVTNHPELFFPMHINTLTKYLSAVI